ncbi:MAG: hypothetical protein ACOC3W_00765 [Thermodesulfobacteriota bacterium]
MFPVPKKASADDHQVMRQGLIRLVADQPEMREAGAEAFVSKTASSGELLKAIYGMAATG